MSTYISVASEWPSAGFSVRAPAGGNAWAHLVADTLVELHEFARALGLKERRFNEAGLPHYELTLNSWGQAHRLGAKQVTRRRLLAIAQTCEATGDATLAGR